MNVLALTDLHQKPMKSKIHFYLRSKEISFDIIRGALLPQSRIVLSESPSCNVICLYSCSLKWCLWYHRLSSVCEPEAHYRCLRQLAEVQAPPRASVFHCKYYKDLGKTKFKSNIFSFVLGTTFQPTIFSPQNSTKTVLGHHLPTATWVNVWLPDGAPDLTVVNVHQNFAPLGNRSNGDLSAVRSVGALCLKDTQHWFLIELLCVADFTVCRRAARPVPLLHPTTRGLIENRFTFLNSFSRGPTVMPAECYSVFSRLFKDS